MPKKGSSCPECGSEFRSAIQYWRPKNVVHGTFDAYKCHDCGYLDITQNGSELTDPYEGKRQIKTYQPDLFGNVTNIRDTILYAPKIVESYAGLSVSVVHIPVGASQQYKEEVEKMRRELIPIKSVRELPSWYKYRKIRRKK